MHQLVVVLRSENISYTADMSIHYYFSCWNHIKMFYCANTQQTTQKIEKRQIRFQWIKFKVSFRIKS